MSSNVRTLRKLYNPRRQQVGEIVEEPDGRRVLVKRGLRPKHKLKKPPGWALDRKHLEVAQQLGVSHIRLVMVDGTTYETSLDNFVAYSFAVSRGFGDQAALTLDRWSVDGRAPHKEPSRTPPPPPPPTSPKRVQLSFAL